MHKFEQYRVQLTAYCYRMLGLPFEAEDAVQEAFLRAWRAQDGFQGRSQIRTWLYRIATNVCLDMMKQKGRRALPVDLADVSAAGKPLGPPLPETAWIEPIPNDLVLASDADPAVIAAQRDTVRLALVAALQHLPPRQRAVLILRDVLDFKAAEVAELLETTLVAVNSALQRAREMLKKRAPSTAEAAQLDDDAARRLLARYVDAFERSDFDSLVALLREDATMSMPPFTWWIRGRGEIYKALSGSDGTCHDSRLVPTEANGMPDFGQYIPSTGAGPYRPWALQVIHVTDGQIASITSFLNGEKLFPLFGLPLRIE